ncbi:MAG TPA: hypothetical protein PKD00_00410 [Burkholderiales bacterium]|nr:hypothetical protein [Burkholderiales bacterium]
MDILDSSLLTAYNDLIGLPNVVGVDFGRKIVGGLLTETPAIIVRVSKKDKTLAEEDQIPTEMFGIATDVVEAKLQVASAFTINEDYIFIGSVGTLGSGDLCYDKDNNPVSCGGASFPNIVQRQIQLYDDVGSDNHNGRIVLGGMSAIGVSSILPGNPCNNMCTLSMAVKDNVDGKLVLLGNQHCVESAHPYSRKDRFLNFPSDYASHITKQNTRFNKDEMPPEIWNTVKLVNPTNSLCSTSLCYDEQIPCQYNDLTGYKVIGSFKASVFMPRNVEDSNAYNETPHLAIITAPPGSPLVPSGTYNLSCWGITAGFFHLSEGTCSNGLTCLQREYINNTPGYIVNISGESFTKVPACGGADAAIWTVPSPATPGTTPVIPLPGVVDLGDGPFEWVTKAELQALLSAPGALKAYKTGARRGTFTDLQNVEILSMSYDMFASVDEFTTTPSGGAYVQHVYPMGGVIHCKVLSGTPNIVAQGGDSGSPVFVDAGGQLKLIGLLSWGNNFGDIFVSPIWLIAERLNISPWLEDTDLAVLNESITNVEIAGRDFTVSNATSHPITHFND